MAAITMSYREKPQYAKLKMQRGITNRAIAGGLPPILDTAACTPLGRAADHLNLAFVGPA